MPVQTFARKRTVPSMRESKNDLRSWLGFNSSFDFEKAKPLGALIGIALILVAFLFVFAALTSLLLFISSLTGFGGDQLDPTGAAIRNIGLVVAALFGAPFIVWRSIVAQKQVDVAEQGQITERITKAVEGLGSVRSERKQIKNEPAMFSDTNEPAFIENTVPNLEVRIGAIFALERISQDSLRDHIQVMEILSAYIRNNSRRELDKAHEKIRMKEAPESLPLYTPLREDLRTALLVIGRRSSASIAYERSMSPQYSLDLQGANFSGVKMDKLDLRYANLEDTIWTRASLRWGCFSRATIRNSDFSGSDLEFSNFQEARLIDDTFDGATLDEGHFQGVYIDKCSFKNCGLSNNIFDDATVSHAFFDGASLMNSDFRNADVSRIVLEGAFLFGTNFSRTTNMDQDCFNGTLGVISGDGETALPLGISAPSDWLDPRKLDEYNSHYANLGYEEDGDIFDIYDMRHKERAAHTAIYES
jgi:uncharacterized protein YjbI with pentapeptide repeats